MGAYLIDWGDRLLDDDEDWPPTTIERINQELSVRGLQALPDFGRDHDGFEEKVSYKYALTDRFYELLADSGTTRDDFVGVEAEVYLPVEFTGLLNVGPAGIYNEQGLWAGSAFQLGGQIQPLVLALQLPTITMTPGGYAIAQWFDALDESTLRDAHGGELWTEDLDTAYFAALFRASAEFAISHGTPIGFC